MACIICSPEIEARLLTGLPVGAEQGALEGELTLRAEVPVEASCQRCASRLRQRAVTQLLTRAAPFLDAQAEILLVSASAVERNLVRRFWRRCTHVSLLADWKDPECLTGVDIRDMPQFAAGRFGFAMALNVLDYIPDAGRAVAEIGRVLRPNGVFLFYIQSFRIDPSLPVGATRVMGGGGYRDPERVYGDAMAASAAMADPGIPDCRFSPHAMAQWAAEAGLEFMELQIADHISSLTTVLYLVRKATA